LDDEGSRLWAGADFARCHLRSGSPRRWWGPEYRGLGGGRRRVLSSFLRRRPAGGENPDGYHPYCGQGE